MYYWPVKNEALVGSILRHIVDLFFPSKPWAPNVHLVRVGLVTRENLGEDKKEEEGSRVVDCQLRDGGEGFGERVFKI